MQETNAPSSIRRLFCRGAFVGAALMVAGCTEAGTTRSAAEAAESAPPPTPPAELILTNGRVYTLRWDDPSADGTPAPDAPRDRSGWHPDAGALAIRDGAIIYVGDAAGAAALRGPRTRVTDLQGATVLPGLVDSHTHVFNLGARLSQVDLYGVETEEEAVARVAAAAREVPPGEWIVGRGWDEGAWADHYPDMTLLSEKVPDHPVYLLSLHSFAGWGNRLAFERAGITAETEAPVGGEIRRFPDGTPSGLLLNRAVPLLESAVPPPGHEALEHRLLLALEQMASDGYVTVHDAGLTAPEMAVLEALEQRGALLPIRVYAMLSVRDEALARDWLERGPDQDADSLLVTRSVKAFYDGALGSRGARLLDDYSDQPGHRGVSGENYGFDEALTAALMQRGFQVAIHAIGDAGNREALDFIAAVYQDDPSARAHRHRVEHAQVLHPRDIPRFARLSVIASMEPPHAVEDKDWAEARLGPERIRGAYAWRSLRQAGAHLTFNADNPGSDHDIFYGLHAAVTRRDKDAQPPQGWYPAQSLTIEEAIRAYTQWSAYAAFRENETGVLAPGRWADITVMDIDPFVTAEQNPAALLEGRIEMTIVGGRVVHPR